MPDTLKILVGGVPFGCDNVGDEAILECGVAILREAAPGCAISVCTNDGPATAKKLGVRTCPLLGFPPNTHRRQIQDEISAHDVFVWCGATGLSDYPEIPLELLTLAQAAGKKTILWGVGMNHELNPALYRLWPGKRRSILRAVSAATLGRFDAVAAEERRRQQRARRKIALGLNNADLVVVRDADSRAETMWCGVTRDVIVGMDSALELKPAPRDTVTLSEEVRNLFKTNARIIGVCISAQRKVQDEQNLLGYLNRIVEDGTVRILFVPMNPVTDAQLMKELRAKMARPDRAAVMEGRHEPAEVLEVVSRLNAIVSSRLHLLIFASIVEVPFIGISRGSKVDTFLKPFGLKSVGVVENLSFDQLLKETHRVLSHREPLSATIKKTRQSLLNRLDQAKIHLKAVLNSETR